MHRQHTAFQISLSATELAYVAGIIDGEGCIQIRPHKPRGASRTRVYQVLVSITNGNEKLIKWLHKSLGGNLYEHRKSYGTVHRMWQINLSTSHAVNMLRAIRPYLIAKAAQCDIAIAFQDHVEECKHKGYARTGVAKGKPILSEDVIAFRELLYQTLLAIRKADLLCF